MSNSLKSIEKLIQDGKRKQAVQHLKVIINTDPTADAWYLMALALNDDEHKIKALKRGLKLDALHTPSNRLLAKLEKVDARQMAPQSTPVKIAPEQERIRQERYEIQQEKKRRRRRRMGCGCLFSMINGMIISIIVLTIAGMLPGMIATVLRLTSGVEPVTVVNEVAIDDTADSFYNIAPVISRELQEQDLAFIDHGYLNEHRFELSEGQAQVVFVQFLSLVAQNVPENVLIVKPDGASAMNECVYQQIAEGYSNGGAWVCYATMSGTWVMRVLGVEGETVGGYVLGMRAVEVDAP